MICYQDSPTLTFTSIVSAVVYGISNADVQSIETELAAHSEDLLLLNGGTVLLNFIRRLQVIGRALDVIIYECVHFIDEISVSYCGPR
jgi:hypothetical protein